jgi:hypothetical protein
LRGRPSLGPAELGFTGGLWNMTKGGNGSESNQFTTEPPRLSLVELPAERLTCRNCPV